MSSGHLLLSGSKWVSGTEPEPRWDVTVSATPGGPGASGPELPGQQQGYGRICGAGGG